MSMKRTCDMCGAEILEEAFSVVDDGEPDILLVVGGLNIVQYDDACPKCIDRATTAGERNLGTIKGHRAPKGDAAPTDEPPEEE